MSSDKLPKIAGAAGVALSAMQVDITTRLGAVAPATPTGFATLDAMLNGGLRAGTVMTVSGSPGVGRTAFSLLVAYMAARARAGVVFASAALDVSEVVARLAARALYREYPELQISYSAIWSGQAIQNDVTRRPVMDAVDTVVRKVGTQLHVYRASHLESTSALNECAAQLWSRHERVVLVVDDIEAFHPRNEARASASDLQSRVTQVGYELKSIAEQGCAVLVTSLTRHSELVATSATLAAQLVATSRSDTSEQTQAEFAGSHVDLVVQKNRLGPTGLIPLSFARAAGLFEERA